MKSSNNKHQITQATPLRVSGRGSFSRAKAVLFTVCLLAVSLLGHAQARYAIVDTKYILDKMPEYKEAQKKLDQTSMQWQKEIDEKQAGLDKMYKEFDA